MSLLQSVLGTAFLGATVSSALVAGLVWRRRQSAANRWLLLLVSSAAGWSFGAALAYLPADLLWIKYVAVNVQLTFTGFLALGWLLFILEYTGDADTNNRLVAALAAEPIAVTLLAWTSPVHGLIYRTIQLGADLNGTAVVWGPLAIWHLVFNYLVILVGALVLLRFVFTARHIYQLQASALLVVIAVPLALNVAAVFSALPSDLTPLGFAVSSIVLYVATTRFGVADVVPVARETVVDGMADGMFVVDTDDRFLDLNQRAAELLDVSPDEAVGTAVTAHLASDEWERAYAEATDADATALTVRVDGGATVLSVRVSPLYDDRGDLLGRVFVVSDVTERERRERELERQNERLEEFASVVSHDLRNPLNVAQMRLELLEDTDGHVDEIETALDRMDVLIADVLTIAREGQTVEETAPISLAECARTAWQSVATDDATLDVEADSTFEGDAERLTRAFENLFRNAVEHGSTSNQNSASSGDVAEETSAGHLTSSDDAGTAVTVRVFPTKGGFVVADDGQGIPPDSRDTVFERNYSTADDGTGLGLTIVRDIVEAHGWQIEVGESESGGARFEITGVDHHSPVSTQTPP